MVLIYKILNNKQIVIYKIMIKSSKYLMNISVRTLIALKKVFQISLDSFLRLISFFFHSHGNI